MNFDDAAGARMPVDDGRKSMMRPILSVDPFVSSPVSLLKEDGRQSSLGLCSKIDFRFYEKKKSLS